jgi:signal peptidase I
MARAFGRPGQAGQAARAGNRHSPAYIQTIYRKKAREMAINDVRKALRLRLLVVRKWLSRLERNLGPGGWRQRAKDALQWAKEPAMTIGLVLASTTALAQPFYVPSGSMEPTLQIGDEIIAAKYAYGYGKYAVPYGSANFVKGRYLANTPARGDVVVFHPVSDPDHAWVKRVIGLPGDHIQMKAGRLFINGRELALKSDGSGKVQFGDGGYREVPRFIETMPDDRKHLIFKWQWDGPLDNTIAFVVPKEHLFMMGDDRDDSFDSRVPSNHGGIGFVPMANLVGRAEFVLGSIDYLNASSILGWPAQTRLARFFKDVR